MTVKRKLHYAVLMILMAFITIQAVAEEKKETQNKPAKKQELKFRVQTRTEREFSTIAHPMRDVHPTHIAMFYASNLPRLEKSYRSRNQTRAQTVANASGDWATNIIYKNINTGTSEWTNDLLASKAAKKITEDHKILISKGMAVTINNASPAEFRVYAHNESDAKYTAEAIIEVLNDYAEAARNELKRKVNDWQKELADLEKRDDKLKKEQTQATGSLEKTKKQAHYLSVVEARERIKELNVYLDQERIEIAGIAAGIDAMREYFIKAGSEKKDALEAKMIDLRIELATVRAKYETAEATRAQAESFISLSSRLEKLKKDIPNISKKIKTVQNYLGTTKALQLIPAADLFTPKIEPAIVTIYTQEKTSL